MTRLAAVLLAGLACACRPSAPDGYWSRSCVTGDGRFLLAGGDHAALVDTASGAVLERRDGMVKAVGCDASGGVVVGYGGAFRLPGGAAVPSPAIAGDAVVATSADGVWISSARTVSAGKWRGPASVHLAPSGDRVDLLPALFGTIGAARALPLPDGFAVRFGPLLADGRLLLSAGWQPSRSGSTVEDVPWAFFAWHLRQHVATPLTRPLGSDPAVNQSLVQRIAAAPDASVLVVAAHDGKRLTVARYARDAERAARVVSLASAGAAAALAVSADGALVAVGSESRGPDAPAQAWVLDASGATVWNATLGKTVAGVHFIGDGSLVVAAGEGRLVKATLTARQ